jgi:hypothetical protein
MYNLPSVIEEKGNSSLLNKVFLFAVILFPFQNLALFTSGSRYDLSAFIILSIGGYIFFNKNLSKRNIIFILSFYVIQIFVYFILNVAPFYRFFSGSVWLGGLLFILLEGRRLKYSQWETTKLIILMLCLTSGYIFFQSFILGYDRPSGWFHEPSFAGLCLYSGAAGLLVSLILVDLNKKFKTLILICFIIFFISGILTLSLHFITFAVSVSLIYFLIFFSIRLFSFNKILIGIFFVVVIVVVANLLFALPHFQSRTDLANPTNLSLLAWLRGLDQMLASISISPLFGCGLGSTGFFAFKSQYSDILESLGFWDLCLTDAFSLAFRLIIEIGIVFFLLFLVFLYKKLRVFKKYILVSQKLSIKLSFPVVFNFVFAISIVLGCFLKEPLYPQSFLYLSIFLLSSIPLVVQK